MNKEYQRIRISERENQRIRKSDNLISVILMFSFWLSVILIILHLVTPAFAKTSIDLGIAGVGARPMAMGRASTAVVEDVNTIFSNPAGLGLQKSWGLTSMSTRLMGRVDYRMAGGVYPTQFGNLGVGYWSVMTPAGYATTDKNSLASASAISYGSSVLMLSYGRDLNDVIKGSSSLGNLSIGANYKMISNRFEGTDGSGSGTSLDLGAAFRPTANLTAGINFQNVGGSVTWKNGTKEEIPMVTRLGGAVNLEKATIAVDAENGGGRTLLHGGVEVRPFDILALRAGVDDLNLTAGVGLKVDGFSFDYAYRQDRSLADNSAHYFSISYQPQGISGNIKEYQGASGNEERRAMDEKKDESIQLPKTDGVYRIAKKVEKKNILSYYE